MPLFLIPFLVLAAGKKHAADRAVDVQRQQYALEVAEFNLKHGTNLKPTKKGVIVYDPQTGEVSNQNINDTYHRAGHNSVSQHHSNPPQPASKVVAPRAQLVVKKPAKKAHN